MTTYSPKRKQISHDWYVVDAAGVVLGRLASEVAIRLMGKHKPGFAPHLDCGDNIVIINASQVVVTGNKLADKKYYRHSGYPGGIKEASLADRMQAEPDQVIVAAVQGMLPKNRLQAERLKRLKVYAGGEHPHQAQTATPLKLATTRKGSAQ